MPINFELKFDLDFIFQQYFNRFAFILLDHF